MHSRDSSAWGNRRSRKNPPSRLFFFSCFPRFFIPPGLFPDGEGWDEMIEEAWWLAAHDWVMGCLSFPPLLFLLLSPCSAYLFLDLSTPFVGVFFFFFKRTFFPASLLFFCLSSIILHSLPREMINNSKRWDEEEGKKSCGLDYNMLQYFSIFFSIFNFLSLLLLTFVFCVLYLPGWKNYSLQFQFWFSSCTSLCTTSYHYLPRTQWWTNPFLSSAVPLYIIVSSSLFWHYNCGKAGMTNKILPEAQI